MAPSSGLWQWFLRLSSALDLGIFNSQNLHIGLASAALVRSPGENFPRFIASVVADCLVKLAIIEPGAEVGRSTIKSLEALHG